MVRITFFSARRKRLSRTEKAQSLVEMAIITPLLIFLMIGVFEVGWALRGYLVLINANREAARFSVRPGYLKFDTERPEWERVFTQTVNASGGMIDFVNHGSLKLTYIGVNTGPTGYDPSDCNEDKACVEAYNLAFYQQCPIVYTMTIRTPMTYPTLTITFGPTRTSHFDNEQMALDLAIRNRQENCRLAIQGGVGRDDGMVIAESWYEQPMLLGFPLISNPMTDPVPMYAHTIFRRIEAKRSDGQNEGQK